VCIGVECEGWLAAEHKYNKSPTDESKSHTRERELPNPTKWKNK
jgi:hypothetical protein